MVYMMPSNNYATINGAWNCAEAAKSKYCWCMAIVDVFFTDAIEVNLEKNRDCLSNFLINGFIYLNRVNI